MLGMGSLGEPQRLSSMTNFSNNSPTVSSGRSISLNQRLTKIKDSRFPLPDTELSRYSLPINSYLNPPNYELSIENFENFSYRRIQLLRFIEKASMQYQDDNDLYREIRVEENRLMPLHSNQSANVKDIFNERFEDEASHFILRLVFSANQEDLRWFCHQETILYRFRLHVLGSEERQEFLAHQMKNHSRISIEEYDRVKSELNCCLATASRESLQKSAVNLSNEICKNIYKIPFEHVPDLVSRRSVYIEKGVAYVPFALCGSFANNRYQAALEYWMNLTAKHVISLKDERVLSIVDALRRSGDESQQALMNSPLFGNLEVVSAKEIDAVSF